MSTKVFVGNLAYATTDHQLRDTFAEVAEVLSAMVIIDRATGQSRGFGFVEFQSSEDAERAIEALNGSTLDGRTINVNVARERRFNGGGGGGRSFNDEPREGGGRGGRRGGGGRRGRGRG